jgi:hypothetical protein
VGKLHILEKNHAGNHDLLLIPRSQFKTKAKVLYHTMVAQCEPFQEPTLLLSAQLLLMMYGVLIEREDFVALFYDTKDSLCCTPYP